MCHTIKYSNRSARQNPPNMNPQTSPISCFNPRKHARTPTDCSVTNYNAFDRLHHARSPRKTTEKPLLENAAPKLPAFSHSNNGKFSRLHNALPQRKSSRFHSNRLCHIEIVLPRHTWTYAVHRDTESRLDWAWPFANYAFKIGNSTEAFAVRATSTSPCGCLVCSG